MYFFTNESLLSIIEYGNITIIKNNYRRFTHQYKNETLII